MPVAIIKYDDHVVIDRNYIIDDLVSCEQYMSIKDYIRVLNTHITHAMKPQKREACKRAYMLNLLAILLTASWLVY